MRTTLVKAVKFTLVALFLPISLSAQSIWAVRLPNIPFQTYNKMITLEVHKATFDNTDLAFLSTWWYLSTRIRAGDNFMLVGELPFGYVKTKATGFSPSRTANHIGNPYIGLEIHRKSNLFFETGVRIPLIKKHNLATIFGVVGDIDRLEAWGPDGLALYGMANLHHSPSPSGLYYRLRVGSSLVFLTGEGGGSTLPGIGSDSNLFVLFSGHGGYENENWRLGTGITGRTRVTHGGSFGKRMFLQLGFNAALKLNRWRPGFHFRIPLDKDFREIFEWAAGLNIGVSLDRKEEPDAPYSTKKY